MKITVLKSTVESALTPILKMVSCSKMPNDFHPTLTFKSDRHSVWLRCALVDNLLEAAMPDAVCDVKNTSFDVTIPPSRCYSALKEIRWFSLVHWRNVYGNTMFAIVGQ